METIYACSILSVLPLSKASALHKTRHGVRDYTVALVQVSFFATSAPFNRCNRSYEPVSKVVRMDVCLNSLRACFLAP